GLRPAAHRHAQHRRGGLFHTRRAGRMAHSGKRRGGTVRGVDRSEGRPGTNVSAGTKSGQTGANGFLVGGLWKTSAAKLRKNSWEVERSPAAFRFIQSCGKCIAMPLPIAHL